MQLMLRRHRVGEDGDYVTVKDLQGFSLGENYPGHYYRAVRVCAHCYKIYNLIENEREASLGKIEREQERAERLARTNPRIAAAEEARRKVEQEEEQQRRELAGVNGRNEEGRSSSFTKSSSGSSGPCKAAMPTRK